MIHPNWSRDALGGELPWLKSDMSLGEQTELQSCHPQYAVSIDRTGTICVRRKHQTLSDKDAELFTFSRNVLMSVVLAQRKLLERQANY